MLFNKIHCVPVWRDYWFTYGFLGLKEWWNCL